MTISKKQNVVEFPFEVDRELLFSNDDFIEDRTGQSEKHFLLLQSYFLKDFLEENEKVMLITKACSPMSVLDSIFGFYARSVLRCLLVFTNKRMFLVYTDVDYFYRHSIEEIPYQNCLSMKVIKGKLMITYDQQEQDIFDLIDFEEVNKLNLMLEDVSFASEVSPGLRQFQRHHLCPECKQRIASLLEKCPHCDLEFLTTSQIVLLAMFKLNGGYEATQRYHIAIIMLIFQVLAFSLTAFMAFIYLVEPPPRDFLLPQVIVSFGVLMGLKGFSLLDNLRFVKEMIPSKIMEDCYFDEDSFKAF